jgi:hypothetical protein
MQEATSLFNAYTQQNVITQGCAVREFDCWHKTFKHSFLIGAEELSYLQLAMNLVALFLCI